MATPSARSKAQEMGLLTGAPHKIPGLRWDPTQKTHVLDTKVDPLEPETVQQALDRLLLLSSSDLVISRFHGMRKLSEDYSAPTLGMLLEIGMRTDAAQETWRLLHQLSQSAVWMSGGQLPQTRTTTPQCPGETSCSCVEVRQMMLGNASNHCYFNALLRALIH